MSARPQPTGRARTTSSRARCGISRCDARPARSNVACSRRSKLAQRSRSWRRGFAHWPMAARVAFLAASVGVVKARIVDRDVARDAARLARSIASTCRRRWPGCRRCSWQSAASRAPCRRCGCTQASPFSQSCTRRCSASALLPIERCAPRTRDTSMNRLVRSLLLSLAARAAAWRTPPSPLSRRSPRSLRQAEQPVERADETKREERRSRVRRFRSSCGTATTSSSTCGVRRGSRRTTSPTASSRSSAMRTSKARCSMPS